MSHFKKIFFSILFCFIFLTNQIIYAQSDTSYVVLSVYRATVDIGDEFYIVALTSTGKKPTWKSSNSSIVSVNTYGKVTAKKAGTASITAKISGAEATCKITVSKTVITLSKKSISLEHGESLSLTASTSNRSEVTWKTSKKSIATVSENGTVTGMKPGETTVTASADGTTVSCTVKVKTPTLRISLSSLSLYRKQQKKLTSTVSSGLSPTWKSNKKSVATVSENGVITAVKHGTAIVTATIDGVSRQCTVTVKQPTITLSQSEAVLKTGERSKITATVSSGISPEWSSSNDSIATVKNGTITAVSKGKAYIYAVEDGVKARCIVTVAE